MSILGNFRSGLVQEWSFAYEILQDDPAFARKIGAKRAFRKLDIHEISPVLKGAGVNTRTLEVKRCLACGSEQPIIEQPKAHACACGAKANGAGDFAALLEELRLLRGEVKALRQDPLARAHARIAAWEQSAAGRKLAHLNGHGRY